MQICCTKKLNDELGIGSVKGTEENDLFCWSVHLIIVNRRKTVVAVNDSNRFGFVLHGLKAKDFKNLNELLIQGIINCLKDEKIKSEIIEGYLKIAGDLSFSKTRGAKYVARLNKACELVNIYEDRFDTRGLFQPLVTKLINDDLIKIYKQSNYEYPYELLHKDFKLFAGEEIIKCEAVDIIIKLNLDRNTAWRRVITPVDITFKQLHLILQVVFGWKSYHLYDFNIFDKAGKCVLNVISEFDEMYEPRQDCPMRLDSEVNLSEYAKQEYKIAYCYDYGDNWEHEITIRGTNTDYDKNYAVCLMGEGNAPPEDVGGISGYEEFLKIMADPNHVDYETMQRWAQSQWYKNFDVDFINSRLKDTLRLE
jgi:hypothetical protein